AAWALARARALVRPAAALARPSAGPPDNPSTPHRGSVDSRGSSCVCRSEQIFQQPGVGLDPMRGWIEARRHEASLTGIPETRIHRNGITPGRIGIVTLDAPQTLDRRTRSTVEHG